MRIVLLAAGAALLTGLLWRLGPSNIFDAFGRIGWYVVPVLLLGGAHHAMRALALRACVLRPDALRYRDALGIRLSGEAIQSLTFTGPLLSQPTKAWLLEGHGLSRTEGFASTITEYLVCAFVTIGMSIVGLLYLIVYFDSPTVVMGVAAGFVCLSVLLLIVAGIAIGRRLYLIGTIIEGLVRWRLLRGALRPDMTWINRMEDLVLIVLRDCPKRVLMIAVIEVAAQALLVLELFWLMRGLDLMAPEWYSLVIEASVKVVGIAFLFIPLQLGVSEGAYSMIFEVMGLPAATGFALAFVRRARMLAIAGVGLAALAVLTRRHQRSPA